MPMSATVWLLIGAGSILPLSKYTLYLNEHCGGGGGPGDEAAVMFVEFILGIISTDML